MSFIWDSVNWVGNSWPFGCLPVICYRGLEQCSVRRQSRSADSRRLPVFPQAPGVRSFSSSCWEQEQHQQLLRPAGHFPSCCHRYLDECSWQTLCRFLGFPPWTPLSFYCGVPSTRAVFSSVALSCVCSTQPGSSWDPPLCITGSRQDSNHTAHLSVKHCHIPSVQTPVI